MAAAPCSIDDCERIRVARGLCGKHYQRWAKYGDPTRTAIIVGDEQARFWSKVDKNYASGCWLWTGSLGFGGYAQFRPTGRPAVMVHRYAYELLVGPIPENMDLDHVRARGCTNRHCVNPDHLEPVTPAENVRRVDEHWSTINARKTHCKRGHEFTADNTARINGRRECRTCKRKRGRVAWRRRKAAARARHAASVS